MKSIRCLIAGIPDNVLADILQHVTEERLGFEVVRRTLDTKDVASIAADMDIDLLFLGEDESEIAYPYSDVLHRLPGTVVVRVSRDGRQICVCVEDPRPAELADLIHAACFKGSNGHFTH